MAGEKKFTRIPPESTGDRVYMIHTAELPYKNKDPNHVWQIGQMYNLTGGLDSNNDFSIHIHGVNEETSTTGVLAVHYSKDAKHQNFNPENNQDIRFGGIDGSIVGNVNGTAYDLYIPAQNIMGWDNPEYGLNIDTQGSAQVTFAEGEPQLDAWGKLRTSGATKLGDYVFSDETVLRDNFSQVETRGGGGNSWETTAYVNYNNTGKYVDVGVRNEKDLATATARTYHHYVAGSSHLFMGTCIFPGAGTINSPQGTGVSRRFGIFDAKNGFMFHVGPDGVLYLEKRNSNSGTKVDTLIACSDPATASLLNIDTFNGDRMNGTRGSSNASGLSLDLTKNNQYWIDCQWHGAGRVRFGVFHNGRRVVVHEYYHNNRYDLPMNQTISLPVCSAVYAYDQGDLDAHPYWSLLNISPKVQNVDIPLRVFSQAMWTETDIDLQTIGKPKAFSTGHLTVDGTAFQYMFSLRVKPLAAGSTNTNHSLILPTRVAVISYDANASTTGTNRDAIVHWRMSVNTIHHNHNWSDIDGTSMQVSYTGANFETTDVEKRILEDMYNGRGEKVLTDTFIDFQYGAWKNASDDGGTTFEPLSAIDGSSTGTLTASATTAVTQEDFDNGTPQVVNVTDTTGLAPGTLVSHPNMATPEHVMMVIDATSFTIHAPLSADFTGNETINFTKPVSVTLDTTDTKGWSLSEPYTKTFGPNPDYNKALNFDGLTLSTDEVYFYFTSKTTAVLYADKDWATPVTSTGTYSGSDAKIYGFDGPEYVISFYAHEQSGTGAGAYQDPRSMFVLEWKEIIQ
jgi:hypothetical protein